MSEPGTFENTQDSLEGMASRAQLLKAAAAIFRKIIDGNGMNQTHYHEILIWLRKYAEQARGAT